MSWLSRFFPPPVSLLGFLGDLFSLSLSPRRSLDVATRVSLAERGDLVVLWSSLIAETTISGCAQSNSDTCTK